MTANDIDEWPSFISATTIRWGMAVRASTTWNAGENYVTPTTGSTQRALGVAMVTASPRGKPVPVAISGIVLVKCQSTAATLGANAVCCATSGEVRTGGVGATSHILGVFAENFTGNTAGNRVKVLLRPGRSG